MTEDHKWAGDTRLIPPWWHIKRTQETSTGFSESHTKHKPHTSKNKARSTKSQVTTTSAKICLKKIGSDVHKGQTEEAPQSKHPLNDQREQVNGAQSKRKGSDVQKGQTEVAPLNKYPLDDHREQVNGAHTMKKGSDVHKGQTEEAPQNKDSLDDQKEQANGALTLKKTSKGHEGQTCRSRGSEIGRMKSKAKEGVGQSQICSGLHLDLTVGQERKNIFYFYSGYNKTSESLL